MGRGPHKKLLARDTARDLEIVASALSRVAIASLAERPFESLSGGEKQRVIIARALAQAPRLLVLDEPTTHLDIGHQHETLSLFRELRLTTLAAVHDLNLAAAYCDHIFVLKAGSIRAHGEPSKVLTVPLIEEVYGVRAVVGHHPLDGPPARVRARNGGCQSDMLGWHFALGAHEGITGKSGANPARSRHCE